MFLNHINNLQIRFFSHVLQLNSNGTEGRQTSYFLRVIFIVNFCELFTANEYHYNVIRSVYASACPPVLVLNLRNHSADFDELHVGVSG